MDERRFPLPGIHFFMNGNPFSGSYQGTSYLITPIKSNAEEGIDSHFTVCFWQGMLCSDLAEMIARADFPLDADGLDQVVAWLEKQFANFVENA